MQLRISLVAIALVVACFDMASAQPAAPATRTFVVGTKPIPPFIIKKPDGTWSGISIDLLERIAEEMKAKLEIRELPLDELLAAKNPAIDITASIKTQILPGTFANHGYAFGLQRDSPMRREFNKALLAVTARESWSSVMRSYLGSTE